MIIRPVLDHFPEGKKQPRAHQLYAQYNAELLLRKSQLHKQLATSVFHVSKENLIHTSKRGTSFVSYVTGIVTLSHCGEISRQRGNISV